jgi:hypothetical protein
MKRNRISFLLAVVTGAVLGLSHVGIAMAQSQCVRVVNVQRDFECGQPDDMTVTYTNVCNAPMDIKVCIQNANRTWTCGLNLNTQPGEQATYYSCHSSGRYMFWALRTTGVYPSMPPDPR